MRRVYDEIVGQRHHFQEEAFIHILRASARQVRPSALADKERVTGKDAVSGKDGYMVLRVPLRLDCLEGSVTDVQLIPIPQVHIDPVPGILRQDRFDAEEVRHL